MCRGLLSRSPRVLTAAPIAPCEPLERTRYSTVAPGLWAHPRRPMARGTPGRPVEAVGALPTTRPIVGTAIGRITTATVVTQSPDARAGGRDLRLGPAVPWPAIHRRRETAYRPSWKRCRRCVSAATYIDRILRGANAGHTVADGCAVRIPSGPCRPDGLRMAADMSRHTSWAKRPSSINIGNRCSFIGELPAGRAEVPRGEGSGDAIGGRSNICGGSCVS